jgi:hypothetical protein
MTMIEQRRDLREVGPHLVYGLPRRWYYRCVRCHGTWEEGEEYTPECRPTSALPALSHAERKAVPLARGLLDYFPAALAAVAEVSRIGGEQHGHGDDIFWERAKSSDHADCILRHLVDRGRPDTDGISHSAKVAWRALALLQEELEAAGATPGRGSRFPARAGGQVERSGPSEGTAEG